MSDDARPVAAFNRLPAERARAELLSVCASPAWAEQMLAARPYHSVGEVLTLADRAVAGLSEAELDAALAGHPRIGEREKATGEREKATGEQGKEPTGRGKAGGRDWSSREQAGVAGASDGVLRALADGNRDYEQRFGHVYLVAATGRTADEMLGLLHRRLGNDPDTERSVVRDELAKINRIRLTKLLA
jgi:2-oxo-4-hydroxy-4-carboxy-5-ureidoimidazoline decarboxylase